MGNLTPSTGSGNSAASEASESCGNTARNDGERPIEFGDHLGSRARPPAELGLPIPHVAGAPQHGANQVLKAARHVKGQVPGRIGDPGHGPPETVVIGKQTELALEAIELAREQRQHVGGQPGHRSSKRT